jgi:hypothetical protein
MQGIPARRASMSTLSSLWPAAPAPAGCLPRRVIRYSAGFIIPPTKCVMVPLLRPALLIVLLAAPGIHGHASMTRPVPRNAADANLTIFRDGKWPASAGKSGRSGCSCTGEAGGCDAGLHRPQTNGQPCLWFNQGQTSKGGLRIESPLLSSWPNSKMWTQGAHLAARLALAPTATPTSPCATRSWNPRTSTHALAPRPRPTRKPTVTHHGVAQATHR